MKCQSKIADSRGTYRRHMVHVIHSILYSFFLFLSYLFCGTSAASVALALAVQNLRKRLDETPPAPGAHSSIYTVQSCDRCLTAGMTYTRPMPHMHLIAECVHCSVRASRACVTVPHSLVPQLLPKQLASSSVRSSLHRTIPKINHHRAATSAGNLA